MRSLQTDFGTVNSDLSVTLPDGREIPRDRMQEIADELKGANRIYKPFILLAWTDCKNGKRADWDRE